MSGFRRAQLRGSDELFRPTRPDGSPAQEHNADTDDTVVVEVVELVEELTESQQKALTPVQHAAHDGALLVRLQPTELELLIGAVQLMKFPGKVTPRPSVEEFEQLEDLRQKLLDLQKHG